ncbi:MAG: UvrD-helicase domain-containing protein [Oscillospiraceae bacterium]|nr:UvrD-helicase domain-containing protein [Oscillospiraceae bacterium]
MDFTKAQREAISTRGGSVLVSAGAGSGKTRVLTERLMEYIDPHEYGTAAQDIDRFLVITFTRAAAGELRARIADAIADRLRVNPNNSHLRRQLLLCRSAQIGTIHSFCGTLLREYAAEAAVSPAFRILDNEKSERMLRGALERVLDRSYEEGEPDFLRLADSVGAGRDDSRLSELVLKLHGEMQSHARPEQWIRTQEKRLEEIPATISDTVWGKDFLGGIDEELAFWEKQMRRDAEEMQGDEKLEKAYQESFLVTAQELSRLRQALETGWDEALTCFPITFPKLNALRKYDDPEFAAALKEDRERCKKAMEKLSAVFSDSAEALLAQQRMTVPEMRGLLKLCTDLEEEFRKSKRRADSLDYADLEHGALRLLTDENGRQNELGKAISTRYCEIMVDEYQDVSRVQDSIFHAVSRDEKNLFFVGDIKQSIYRFRLADPTIFTEKAGRFGKTENGRGEKLIHLRENFRSRPEILDAVNDVFTRCMSRELGDLDYRGDELLVSGAAYPDGGTKPELLLIPSGDSEPERIGREILKLIEGKTWISDGEGQRELRFGDIAVLHRSANSVGEAYRRTLLAMGIPVSAAAGGDFYRSEEVTTVISMLLLIDNPHRDIPLLAVLQSPSFGFSEDRLGQIRAETPGTDFYTALCAADGEDVKRFRGILNALRTEAPDLDPIQMTERIIEELDLYALCAAMPDSEKRLRRLIDLSSLAEDFLATGDRGLHRFLHWLRGKEERREAPESTSGGGNAVHLLSIHRSKGLEFPVVFYSGLGRMFNHQDITSAVLMHPQLGLGPKLTDTEKGLEYPTIARRAIARRLTGEGLSEELRLMYVAMTRAKERLIMTACVSKPEEQKEKALSLCRWTRIPATLLRSASAPYLWVLPAALDGRTMSCRVATAEESPEAGDEQKKDRAAEADPDLYGILERNLTYVYPWKSAETLPSKITATQRKEADTEENPDAAFLPEKEKWEQFGEITEKKNGPNAARKGTAAHLVLQLIDFAKTDSTEKIRGEIERLCRQGFLTEEEAATVRPEMILGFFLGDLGRRILRAEKVWREFRFSLLVKAAELLPGESETEKILLQGAVDLCFVEDGSMVLVDYKTDRIESTEELAERVGYYRLQLDTYAKALERIFGMPVKEKNLYFLKIGKQAQI